MEDVLKRATVAGAAVAIAAVEALKAARTSMNVAACLDCARKRTAVDSVNQEAATTNA